MENFHKEIIFNKPHKAKYSECFSELLFLPEKYCHRTIFQNINLQNVK